MFLGTVIGRMVCSMVYEGMEDVPLLWVPPLDKLDADAHCGAIGVDRAPMNPYTDQHQMIKK